MHRTLLPLVLIVLVLLGAWMIWPQPEPRGPLAPTPSATETLPARAAERAAEVEAPAPQAGRTEAGAQAIVGMPYNSYLESAALAVESGAPEIVLRARPGAEVAGRVVDADGAGVQAAITVGSSGRGMTMTRTEVDGSFRFDGLAPGSYTLFASTSGGLSGELGGLLLDPAAPVEGLAVVLGPGARVRVRYEGSGVGQLNVRRNGAAIGGDGIEGGRSLTQVVPVGKVGLEFRYPEIETPELQEIEIGAGEEREIVFRQPAK